MALSFTAVNAAKGRDKPYKLTDSGGLYLFVTREGRRYWRMNYRHGGKQRTLAFGVYPDIGLADARSKRDAARKLLANGEDPRRGARMTNARRGRKPKALSGRLRRNGLRRSSRKAAPPRRWRSCGGFWASPIR